jgi:hypothetical protein
MRNEEGIIMKKFTILLFLSVSVGCLANDLVVPKGGSCPEGGYHPSNSRSCCKDGFVYESYTRKYDGIQAHICGCPYGGSPSETCGVTCCKDGYAFGANIPGYPDGSGKYDVLKPGCCCPYGGTRSETGACCKDKYAFNEESNKYDLIDASCGCPDGGTPTKFRDRIICCNNGFAEGSSGYSHKENYKHVWPELCGCPENGVPVQTGSNSFECCQAGKTGYRWSVDSYSDFTPNYCGCPDGGKYGERKNKWGGWDEVPYCCKDGYLFDKYETKSYSKIDIKCGCPKGHEQECVKRKEYLENPEKVLEELKELITHMQDKEQMKDVVHSLKYAVEKAEKKTGNK